MTIRDYMAVKLKEARKDAGLSVDEVGKEVDKSGKTVSAWEVGRGQPDADTLIKLCILYNVPISYFYEPKYNYAVVDIGGRGDGYLDVPIYGEIAAGTPIDMTEIDNQFPVPISIRAKYPSSGLLRVNGDSYNRTIPNGYLALVDFDDKEPNEHDPYAVCVNGYTATIKKVKRLANGFELIPNSYDPTYLPIVYDYNKDDTEEITIIGKVVWATMPFDYEI